MSNADARGCFGTCVAFVLIAGVSSAQAASSGNAIEEVIVTAQRQSESVQDVPIAVTAMSGEMMQDKQVLAATDLQLNAPNVSFTPTNFGGSSFSIRGIGSLVIGGGGDSGVSTHINEIPVASNLAAVEYFDVERIEILRGPQGTLFGRNATGGAINMATAMPNFESVKGYVDAEYGDYDHRRLSGMVNIPITDTFAIRAAAMGLKRNGYIKNVAHGQLGVTTGLPLQGIDSDLDGRDWWAGRITASWDINDQSNLWVQYSQFEEDDDKARITNQVCVTNDLPLQGCKPDEVGFEGPHLGTTTGGLFGGFFGALPLGDPGNNKPGSRVRYEYPRPSNIDFRKQHTDYEPNYETSEKLWTAGFSYEFDQFSFNLLGAYQETDSLFQQDYNMDVGPTLTPVPGLGLNSYPTSAPAGRAGDDWTSSNCNYNAGTSGLLGGCKYNVDETRVFAADQADEESEYWTVEGRVSSSFEGRFNFLLGGSTYDSGANGDYYVASNTLDILATVSGAYPATFNSTGAPNLKATQNDGYAVFGEMYFDVSDDIKLTIGLRYNEDNKETQDANAFLDASFIPGGGGEFSREPGFAAGLDTFNAARAELYGATAAFNAAIGTPARSPERLAAVRLIPLVPQPGERRKLTNSPSKFQFKETTGRIGLDWAINDDSMVYGFYTRGYKPGGYNPPVSEAFQGDISFDFDSEQVDSFEIGTKNTLADGTLVVNASAFYYKYEGLQITRIANNSSINANIDANIYGLEVESFWNPEFVPGLALDFAYSYLHTEVDGAFSPDPTNRTASDPAWVTLENIQIGALTGVNYVARRADITPQIIADAIPLGAAFPIPGTIYPDGLPAYFNRAFLDSRGVATSDGLNSDLDGNSLPNAPEHKIHLGAAYTWDMDAIAGSITLRYDYYWQANSFAREFNTKGDEIDSWSQHNASVIYESANGKWSGRAWIRNIANDDNITGHYLTADTSGFYRNYFLTEPRIFGASVRYNFGAD